MSTFRRQNRNAQILICAVCTLLIAALYYYQFPPLHRGEFYTEDMFLLSPYTKRAPLSDRIIFLAIDNNSIRLDQLDPAVVDASPELTMMKNGWPWSRAIYPAILDRLFNAEPRWWPWI